MLVNGRGIIVRGASAGMRRGWVRVWFWSGLFWCEVGTCLGCEGFLHRPFNPSRVEQFKGYLLIPVAFFDDTVCSLGCLSSLV